MSRDNGIKAWIKNGEHLPYPIRDFHDQKDVFKSLHKWIGDRPTSLISDRSISWMDGQCYVIDYFLRFMAAHGWTMQRTRKTGEFADLSETIKRWRDEEAEYFRAAMTDELGPV